MTDRNLSDLCPELQGLAPVFIAKCAQSGVTVKIIITWRDAADQNEAKACGLSNAFAGQSPHNYCKPDGTPCALAFDFACYTDNTYNTYITDGTDSRYKTAGTVAEDLGLSWGGRWLHPDYDHVELANWKTYCNDETYVKV